MSVESFPGAVREVIICESAGEFVTTYTPVT
jgi:hypothetical protein